MKHLKTLEYIARVGRSGSIRSAAEALNITPSALTRKIQDFEQELGHSIFERLPQGMRLNAAGELLLRHIHTQVSDFERLRSQIADLSGIRRGHVAIACSQGFADHILPREIEDYRAQFPLVSFEVHVRDHLPGVEALTAFEADLALLIQPPPSPDMDVLHSSHVPLCALMRSDHPLAEKGPVRLRECLDHPVAFPDHSLAIRYPLDVALTRMRLSPNVAVESNSLELLRNYTLRENVVSFQVSIGVPDIETLCVRPIDSRDMAGIQIVLGQLRGRTLPIASAKFADQMARKLARL